MKDGGTRGYNGFYALEAFVDTSVPGRGHLNNLLVSRKGTWGGVMRKTLDLRASPGNRTSRKRYAYLRIMRYAYLRIMRYAYLRICVLSRK